MNSTSSPKPVSLSVLRLFMNFMIRVSIVIELFVFWRVLGRAKIQQIIRILIVSLPNVLIIALIISSFLTIVCQLAVISLVRPRMLKWGNPKVDDSSSAFHLEPREVVEVDLPCRMKDGRSWRIGRLVRTNRRVMFLPTSWNVEPWMCPIGEIDGAQVVASPSMFWNSLRNLPPQLRITPRDESSRLFVVPDPYAWLPGQPASLVGTPLPVEQRVS